MEISLVISTFKVPSTEILLTVVFASNTMFAPEGIETSSFTPGTMPPFHVEELDQFPEVAEEIVAANEDWLRTKNKTAE